MKNEITVYSTNDCIYCTRAKDLLQSLGLTYREVHVDRADEKARNELEKKTGMRTFPQIFVGDQVVGGYSQLKDLHEEGKFLSLLNV